MEAGKEHLTRDTVRDATRQEIEHLKRENHDGRVTTEESRRKSHDLKQLVADPSLEVRRFKRTALPAFDGAERPGEVERHKPAGDGEVASQRKEPPVCTGGPYCLRKSGGGYLSNHTCSKRLAWEYCPEKCSSGAFFT